MIELLVDQNFKEDILDGLTRLDPSLEVTYARHVGLDAAADEAVLEWAAAHGLVLLTHDRKTVPPLAYARVEMNLWIDGNSVSHGTSILAFRAPKLNIGGGLCPGAGDGTMPRPRRMRAALVRVSKRHMPRIAGTT
ncbi:MAG TPA: DUF5615 family PIN-like protein [Pirellulales bacterium]|nr:DUF5615 family PIN-like protein [Pirellulales bacterium]